MNEYRIDLRVVLPEGLNKSQVISHLSSATKHSSLLWWVGVADIISLGEYIDEESDCE